MNHSSNARLLRYVTHDQDIAMLGPDFGVEITKVPLVLMIQLRPNQCLFGFGLNQEHIYCFACIESYSVTKIMSFAYQQDEDGHVF